MEFKQTILQRVIINAKNGSMNLETLTFFFKSE